MTSRSKSCPVVNNTTRQGKEKRGSLVGGGWGDTRRCGGE